MNIRRACAIGLLLSAGIVAGCSSNEAPVPYDGSNRRLPSKRSAGYVATPSVARLPWEVWPLGADLHGRTLQSESLKQGDEAYRSGDRAKALELYQRALGEALPKVGEMAAVYRIAALELTLDRPARALQALSTFFRAAGGAVDAVDARFSLLFAYSYGRSGDSDQAFAWFSRAARESRGGPLQQIATAGIRYFLERTGDERWEELSRVWESDLLVSRLIEDEKKRRAAGGRAITALTGGPSWWQGALPVVSEPVPGTVETVGQHTVGALLPLSGKYVGLGQQLKNGMELAAVGLTGPSMTVTLSAIDSGESGATAAAAATAYLASNGGQPVIIGPLIAEHVSAVADVVRAQGATMVHLAKRGDTPIGRSVFRLGVTVRSQMASLIEAGVAELHLQKVALVYPADGVGAEYLDAFRSVMAERSVPPEALVIRAYAREELDGLVTIAQEFETLGVDGVILPDTIDVATRFFAALDPRFRSKIRPLGLAQWDNAQALANSQEVMFGAVFVSPFFVDGPRAVVRQFVESYQSRYQVKPDFLAALGFDAVTMVGRALEVRATTPGSLSDALVAIGTYDGLTGTLAAREDGEISRRYTVLTLGESGVVELNPIVAPSQPEPVIAAPELGQ